MRKTRRIVRSALWRWSLCLAICVLALPASAGAWTDDLSVGNKPIRGIHINELRTAVDTIRASSVSPGCRLPPVAWSEPIVGGLTRVRAIHLNELRTAIQQVYQSRGLALPVLPPTLVGGERISADHLLKLRAAIDGLTAPCSEPPVICGDGRCEGSESCKNCSTAYPDGVGPYDGGPGDCAPPSPCMADGEIKSASVLTLIDSGTNTIECELYRAPFGGCSCDNSCSANSLNSGVLCRYYTEDAGQMHYHFYVEHRSAPYTGPAGQTGPHSIACDSDKCPACGS